MSKSTNENNKEIKAEKTPSTAEKVAKAIKAKTEPKTKKPSKDDAAKEKKAAEAKAKKAPKDEKKKDVKAEQKKPAKTTEKKTDSKKKTEASKKSNDKWSIKQLGGYLFAKMMRGGASSLQANAEEVNKLNVFPVPDGDTGDNMSMTIQSGVASLDNIDTDDLAEVLRVASKGMLLGARGNSGVILSQFFRGISKAF